LVFLRKDILFTLKIFWPQRSDARGFSIENLAKKYREKIARNSSNKKTSPLLEDTNSTCTKEDKKNLELSNLSIKREHWANRDFSEYRDAA
tara:strand:- start:61 stop:333 length:273 start_codon:yes stop_codon:yes gene_type:complete